MLLPYITFLCISIGTFSALDTISLYQNITDGETIISSNNLFELGFFSPRSSKNRYLGIWFKNTSPHTVVWVANRETPLIDRFGMVILDSQGVLSIVNGGGTNIWSSNSSAPNTNVNPIAQLLDSGNLVITDESSVIWESFEYPGDTLIHGMKLGKNFVTGRENYLTSWKSTDDPSPGEYTIKFVMVQGKYPQVYISKGSVIETRIGPYDGIEFAGQPNYRRNSNELYQIDFVVNQKQIYYTHNSNSPTFSSRSVMTPGGKLEIWLLNMNNQEWMHDLTVPEDYCDNYGTCGPYGSCSTATYPNCVCLKGFELTNTQELYLYNWKAGCRRSRSLDCGPREGFIKFSSMKLPDTQNALFNARMSLQECEIACKDNCSCTAYANPNSTQGGVGCLHWFGDLIDVRVYSLNGQDFYVRLAASELSATCTALETIAASENIITDGETIVSGNERFELGFFSPGSSKNRYLGIWFKNTSPFSVVWVANREIPLINNLGLVKLDRHGILSLVSSGGTGIWSSNTSASSPNIKPTAELLDSGNLVIKDENSVLWQSFDYPGDTIISGMKLGTNFITGRETYVTSWRSADDPSPGEYTVRFLMVKGKYIQVYIRKNSVIQTRIGPYDGMKFAGLPSYKRETYVVFVINQKEMFYLCTYNNITSSLKSVVTPGGKLEVWQLNMLNQEWRQDITVPIDYCDSFGMCGPYGSCSTATFPNCACLRGFERKTPEEPNIYNWTNGCRRSRTLDCGHGEGFLKLSSMKLPDTQNAVFDGSMSLQECEVACKDNCSCTAYANPNISRGGVGCLQWFGELIDVRVYSLNGQDLYIRLADSELLDSQNRFSKKEALLTALISASSTVVLLFLVLYACIKKRKMRKMQLRGDRYALAKKNATVPMEDIDELPFFSLHEIVKATNQFSIDNKLGEGGFGPVYKGILKDGREVAVKRLSDTSQQGLDEFKNEVICIAKLQHRNLVKLLGYCVHENEKILVYEYMANKSLDRLLFDEYRSSMLDWPQRFHIINGIARGILYLHQDSRLQIIHRDLKAGNILLDDDMNPKISDFGLARKFVGSDSIAKTKKVVGTHGYISPEYAVHGHYSTKSDVFSFGVMVLEIVSGKKNRGFSHEDHSDNLLGHAWRLYKENRSIELMSPSLHDSCIIPEVLRSIHVGLLCVQHNAQDRPTMLSVVLMLVSEGVLPQPKQPAFFTGESQSEVVSSAEEYTITQMYAR